MEVKDFIATAKEELQKNQSDSLVVDAMKIVLSSLQPELNDFGGSDYVQLLQKDWNDALIKQHGGTITKETEEQIMRVFQRLKTRMDQREARLRSLLDTCITMLESLLSKPKPKFVPKRPRKQNNELFDRVVSVPRVVPKRTRVDPTLGALP